MTKPEIGMGGTIYYWSDRVAVTVIEVRTDRKIIVQSDKAIRTDNNGMSEIQDYRFETDPNGSKHTFTKRKDGIWREMGGKSPILRLGYRRHYYDYSF